MEEIITSGRNIPHIDPILDIWGLPISLYLFLGGLAAGITIFASVVTILKREQQYSTAVKIAPIITPIALAVGLFFLLIDLHHILYAWQLFTTIRLESPMSWGAWTLLVITPLSIVWVAMYLKDILPTFDFSGCCSGILKLLFVENNSDEKLNWEWKYSFLVDFEKFMLANKRVFAWIMLVLGIVVGVYTGILLSAFNARPLWNTEILGPLFLVSGLSTGAAAIMWLSNDHNEIKMFSKIDLFLILIELFLIVHMMMGFVAGPEIKAYAAGFFLGGEFTAVFWVLFVGLGLVIPLLLETMELIGRKIPIGIVAFLILAGGLLFRIIMVDAGQVIRYLY
ncbi:MAG: polysulfide reductase NrfD [Bacteroidales bacterium]|nr:polysulfide reductase NrfD [Bacteroidales bacterium]